MRAVVSAIALVAVLVAASKARAAGSEITDQSASASGTGGASTARSNDPGAAYFNPAALADGKGLRIGQGTAFALPTLTATSIPGGPGPAFAVGASKSLQLIPYLAASYADRDLVFGLSVHVPFGAAVSWPAGSALRFDAVQSSLRVFRVAPFVGARFGKISFAVGPQLDIAELEATRATNMILAEGHVHLLLHGVGIGGQAAIFAQPTEDLAFGLSYKSRSLVPLSGDAAFDLPPAFSAQYPDQGVTARLKLPDRIALGAAYSLPRARILADVTYTLWSFNDELSFQFSPGTPSSTQKNAWRDTLAVRVGGEYDVSRMVTLRAGAFVDGLNHPAAPPENLAPSAPDMTRVGGSVGAGFQITKSFAADVFYSFFALVERTSTSADATLATYGGSAHLFGVGIRFAWDPSGS
jgi:long-chain fatty acid transport protein